MRRKRCGVCVCACVCMWNKMKQRIGGILNPFKKKKKPFIFSSSSPLFPLTCPENSLCYRHSEHIYKIISLGSRVNIWLSSFVNQQVFSTWKKNPFEKIWLFSLKNTPIIFKMMILAITIALPQRDPACLLYSNSTDLTALMKWSSPCHLAR